MVNKIIHRITGPRATNFIRMCQNSWQKLTLEGFEIRVWDDSTIYTFLESVDITVLELFRNARNHGEASDIARYAIIYHFGGYYIDWDIELTNSELFLKLHIEHPQGYLLRDPKTGIISPEHFSACKNEIYLLVLLNEIRECYDEGNWVKINTQNYTGPNRMTTCLNLKGNFNQEILEIKSVFEFDYWESRNIQEVTRTRPMVHYWLHTWM